MAAGAAAALAEEAGAEEEAFVPAARGAAFTWAGGEAVAPTSAATLAGGGAVRRGRSAGASTFPILDLANPALVRVK